MTRSRGRARLLRSARRLEWLTIGWNVVEAFVAIGAGVTSGSAALVGFGLDSLIEVTAAGALLWRLHQTGDLDQEEIAERRALRIVGYTFYALAAYVTYDAVNVLARRAAPEESWVGVALAVLSLVVMPFLGLAKRNVARALPSRALAADAVETLVCAYLSLTLLVGLLANSLLGWWWADPLAALTIVYFVLKEGKEALEKAEGEEENGK